MKHPFWKSTSILLESRRHLALALGGALISAGSFGIGLGLTMPAFQLLVGQRKPLADLIRDHFIGRGLPRWVEGCAAWAAATVPSDPFWAFVVVLAVITGLGIIGSAGGYFHELITLSVQMRAAMGWRDRLFRHLVRLPWIHFHRFGTADNMSRLISDTGVLGRGYEAILSRTLADISQGAAALVVALIIDWRLTLAALVTAPLFLLILRRLGHAVRRASRRTLQQYGQLLNVSQSALLSIPVVKTHGAEAQEERRFAAANQAVYAEEMSMRQVKALAGPLIETLALLGIALVAGLAAWYVFRQNVEPATLLTLLLALTVMGTSVKPLTKLSQKVNEAGAAAARLFEVLEMETEPVDVPSDRPPLARHRRDVVFENICFTYPGQERAALLDVHLQVSFGQFVAVVGTNGSGKSTLLNLLPRLIEPQRGRVLLDGVDLAGADLAALRRQISVVAQETVLFQDTIARNIAYGLEPQPMEKIIAAAQAASADDFIRKLPRGYDTVLGELGAGISSGEKQRLAIARAVLRDPAILLLDEATSQIDSDSEAKINEVLRTFRRKRTLFVIAHRLSTVADADQIAVMAEGTIVDVGRHEALLHRCRVYRALVESHFQFAQAR